MNKSERENLLDNYTYYCRASRDNIVEKESLRVARNMISSVVGCKLLTEIENKITWECYPRILHDFDHVNECIKYCMKDYCPFEYNIDSLEYIKDEIQFYAESERQSNAIIEFIDDLIVRINCREKVF